MESGFSTGVAGNSNYYMFTTCSLQTKNRDISRWGNNSDMECLPSTGRKANL